MKKTIKIEGLDCASCAAGLEGMIKGIKGVTACSVNFSLQKINIEYSDARVLEEVKSTIMLFDDVKILDSDNDKDETRKKHLKELLRIVISAVLLTAAMILSSLDGSGWILWISYGLFGAAYLVVGLPVLITAVKNLFGKHPFNENFLMSIASVGAFIIGELFEGVMVMLLYAVGELLQSIAVGSSRRSISNLVSIRSETATVLVSDYQVVVPPEKLNVGDIVLVKAGEKIPVDGIVVEGTTDLDTKSLTGEFKLKPVTVGDEVLSGCINMGGNIKVKTTRKYVDSAVAKIMEMVENASDKKSRTEKTVTVFARFYTPIVCILAVVIGFIVPALIWAFGGFFDLATWVHRALVLLVVSCPCAIVISIPLTYFCAIGSAAKQGILVKGATFFDTLAKTRVAAFDKTGTLTKGEFSIVKVEGDGVVDYVAAAERGSSHPIAKPFESIQTKYVATEVKEIAGKGVSCLIDGKRVLVGNYKLLDEAGVACEKREANGTLIYVAVDGKYIGMVELDDTVKEDATAALADLKATGVARTVILTGDNKQGAQRVARKIGGIDEDYCDILPDKKAEIVEELKKEGVVLYVGDGINDTPVMTVADCAVSMGKLGSAAAVEASDVVLPTDNLKAVPKAVKIAKKTKARVIENLTFAILAKVVFMVLGVLDLLPMWLAVIADVGVMLLTVLNATRVSG